MDPKLTKALKECGFTINHGYFDFLDEAQRVQVTDSAMTDMFKFITDKYNSIDFSEIEKSAGDYKRFKYRQIVDDNIKILRNIYEADTVNPGAKTFLEVLNKIGAVEAFLDTNREEFTFLYRNKDGVSQILYTSLVSAVVYSVSALVSDTIRFITVEDDPDLQIVYEETNNAAKNVHIKNILAAYDSMDDLNKYVKEAYKHRRGGRVQNESITVGLIAAGLVILLIPRIIPLIRQIIYSIFYARVSISQAIDVQIYLIKTNIESLESTGRSNKKVIAKQKNIVKMLTKASNLIAVKTDNAEAMTSRKIKEENKTLTIDRNPSAVSEPSGTTSITVDTSASSDLLL